MTEKKQTPEFVSKCETSESPKWGLKEKTLSLLRSLWERVAESFRQISKEDLEYMEDRLEEIRWLH